MRRYNEPHWYNIGRLNNRTHRKLLVVDGRVGFTGGVGIADQWLGNGQQPDEWRDTHFRIEGPAVAQLQAAFIDNWIQATGEVLHGHAYFPDLKSVGSHHAQVFTSSPGGGADSMQLLYLLSIAAATKTIRLSMSYFVPDNVAVDTFVEALKRGVKVQMILPVASRKSSRRTWRDHAALLTKPGRTARGGKNSSNTHPRSLTRNSNSWRNWLQPPYGSFWITGRRGRSGKVTARFTAGDCNSYGCMFPACSY